jgi:hypothetical protein
MKLLDELKTDIEAARLLADWLGEGGTPVPSEQSAGRALVCLQGNDGRPCPHNTAPGWWAKHVKNPIAAAITKQLEITMNIKIDNSPDWGKE